MKSYKPITLQDVIRKARDMQDSIPKTKFSPKLFVPTKEKEVKPPQRDWVGRNKMDHATRQELRKKKLCFSCQEPWVPGHRCIRQGKAHYIEVYSDSGDEEEEIQEEDLHATGDE